MLHMGSGATAVLITHSRTKAILLTDRIAVLTARPGRIYEVRPVPLPRPRTPERIFTSELIELSITLRRLLAHAEQRRECA
jgi:NitT/TauT family transport system ATP-binding protein